MTEGSSEHEAPVSDRPSDPAPDPQAMHHLSTQVVGPVILCESTFGDGGRAPLMVGAAHALTTWLRPDAVVIVAGPVDDLWEFDALLRWCVQLNLTGIWLAADPTAAVVSAFRQRAQCTIEAGALTSDLTASQLATAMNDVLGAQEFSRSTTAIDDKGTGCVSA